MKVAFVLALAACLAVGSARPVGLRKLQQTPPTFTGAFTTPDHIPVYIAAGDVTSQSAVLWVRCPEASAVKFHLNEGSYHSETASPGGGNTLSADVTADTDYTVKIVVENLKPATKYAYKASCYPTDRSSDKVESEEGSFRTAAPPDAAAATSFAWVADIAGQGWGISKERTLKLSKDAPFNGDVIEGGFYFAEAVSRLDPEFVVWAGDSIYADGAIPESKPINLTKNNGAEIVEQGVWMNDYVKDFQAVTLKDFRRVWLYNLFDQYYAKLLRSTSNWPEWDDHEVTNNWYPGEKDARPGLDADDLLKAGRQAFYEYTPIKPDSTIYRKHQHGKHLEVFNIDMRSYKSSNVKVTEENQLAEFLGETQFKWLETSLKESTATWKIVVNDLPLGYAVTDGPNSWEAVGQAKPEDLGRELQLSKLLKFIKDEGISGVIFISADVHMSAIIQYTPSRATGFTEFNPFYEFVIGACHAGGFGNPDLDTTFGPQHLYLRTPATEGFDQVNVPPPYAASFGYGQVDESGKLTLQVRDLDGSILVSRTFVPGQY